MTISLIVAHDRKKGIGFNNKLPWKLPRDMKRFVHKTEGHTVVMGRKTYESIGKPLPNRKNIVMTRDSKYEVVSGVSRVASKTSILARNSRFPTEEIFIIGGAEIYRQFIHFADKIYVTEVDAEIESDVFFPQILSHEFHLIDYIYKQKDVDNIYNMTFKTYSRRIRQA